MTKTVIKSIPCFFLTACISTKPYPQVFNISADTISTDRLLTAMAVEQINQHLGCQRLILQASDRIFTPADEGRDYDFVAYSNDPDIAADLQGSVDIIGQEIGYLGSPETDIELTSWVLFPGWGDPRFKNQQIEYDRMVIHEFGHAMGLRHTGIATDIMYPYLSNFPITDAVWDSYLQQIQKTGFRCP